MKWNARFLIAATSLVLSACTSSISMKAVNLDSFFNDNSSKVWLVDNISIGGNEVSPINDGYKDVFIFYKSGKIAVQPLNSLGNTPKLSGYFFIDSDLKTMKLEFKKTVWKFKIDEISLKKVVLSPEKSSDFEYGIVLIPLPEF